MRLVTQRALSQLYSTGVAASCCGVCFAVRVVGALHKIDGFMKKENYLNILKLYHLKTSARKIKLGRK